MFCNSSFTSSPAVELLVIVVNDLFLTSQDGLREIVREASAAAHDDNPAGIDRAGAKAVAARGRGRGPSEGIEDRRVGDLSGSPSLSTNTLRMVRPQRHGRPQIFGVGVRVWSTARA